MLGSAERLIAPPSSPLAAPEREAETPATVPGDYAALKRLLQARGLFEPQPRYYASRMLISFALLAVSLTVMALVGNVWLQLLNAVFLMFVLTQVAFLAHDTGHRQIIRRGWGYELLALGLGNLVLGISSSWWNWKHNAHHSRPNQQDHDPDISIPLLAFSVEQALEMRGVLRLVGSFQAYLLVPFLLFQSHSMRIMGTLFTITRTGARALIEVPLIALQYAVLFWLLLQRLPLAEAVAVYMVSQALFGMYLAAVFAPNHKGMPVIADDDPIDFLHRQVITARNVHSGRVIDLLYGGLNYQIEHHLFPTVRRNKLKEAQAIIRPFCEAQGIVYHETGPWSCYREVFGHFNAVSRVVRNPALALES